MYIEIAPPKYQVKMPQNTAKMYCFSLNIDGKVGWREPTTNELHKITKSIDYEEWASNRGCWSADGYTILRDCWSLPWPLINDYELNTPRLVVPVRTLPEVGWFGRLIYKWNGYREIL
jgi:hypothetical protein